MGSISPIYKVRAAPMNNSNVRSYRCSSCLGSVQRGRRGGGGRAQRQRHRRRQVAQNQDQEVGGFNHQ